MDSFGQEGPNLPTPPTAGQMQKQAARKRTFEELPKPDIYRSYRHPEPPVAVALMVPVLAPRVTDDRLLVSP